MRSLEELTDYAQAIEELGFHSLFIVEHHFTGTGQISSTLSLLAYLAAVTRKIRLGTAVTVLPWHNPALLAEEIATVDQISQGRLDIGIGRGYRPREYAGFGITSKDAAARSEEIYAFLRRAWTTPERFSHQGRYWAFDNIVIDPPVFQRPHPPIWLGASSLASIERAGREDMNLLLDQVAPLDLVLERFNVFRTARIASGQAFDPVSVAVTRAFQLANEPSEREAAQSIRARMLVAFRSAGGSTSTLFRHLLPSFSDSRLTDGDASIIGYLDEIVDRVSKLWDGGVRYLMLADISGDIAGLETFMTQVAPLFANEPAEPPSV